MEFDLKDLTNTALQTRFEELMSKAEELRGQDKATAAEM